MLTWSIGKITANYPLAEEKRPRVLLAGGTGESLRLEGG
jgi:hypothetical protein